MKQTEIDILVRTLQGLADIEAPPPPPPPPEQATVRVYPYITLNGVRPKTPQSFFSTKRFYVSAALTGLFVGFMAYFFIFA